MNIPALSNFESYGAFINYCVSKGISLTRVQRKQAINFYFIGTPISKL